MDIKYIDNRLYYSIEIYQSLLDLKVNIKIIDKYLYIFHAIYSKCVFDKRYKKRDQFVQLKADILRKIIGRNYKKILDFLLKNGFIETDNHYKVGQKSKSYRMSQKYWTTKFILKQASRIKLPQLIISENHSYLLSLLNNVFINPLLLEQLQNSIKENSKTKKSKEFVECFLYAFENKDFNFNTDKKTGRIFNILVNAPRYIRQFLLFNGEGLKELDIRASQPLLLNTLYKPQDSDEEKVRFRYITEKIDFYDYLIKNSETKLSRPRIKKALYYFLFGEKMYEPLYPIRDFFRNNFPILLTRINEAKATKHADLAILLQKMEANAIINNVVTFCRKNKIPVFPIHDSFMLLDKDVKRVENETVRVFNKLYNLTPQLVVKKL